MNSELAAGFEEKEMTIQPREHGRNGYYGADTELVPEMTECQRMVERHDACWTKTVWRGACLMACCDASQEIQLLCYCLYGSTDGK